MKTSELIELYIDGELEGEELSDFQLKLENDDALRKQVELRREINESIVDDDVYYLRKRMSILIPRVVTRKRVYYKYSAIAAACIIAVLSTLYFQPFIQPEVVCNSFYSPYQTDLNTRSDDKVFLGVNFAVKLYAEKEYEASYELLKNYSRDNFNNPVAKYYLALNAMELNRLEEAELYFVDLIESAEYGYVVHAKWYLSLIYLKQDDLVQARALLNELKDESGFYEERAKALLKKCR